MGPVIQLVNGPLDGQHKEWISGREVMEFFENRPIESIVFDPHRFVGVEHVNTYLYRRGTGKHRDLAYWIEQ